jgi:hypothetical protein
MRAVARWGLAVAVSAAAFAVSWRAARECPGSEGSFRISCDLRDRGAADLKIRRK